jgi:hypothetical protein
LTFVRAPIQFSIDRPKQTNWKTKSTVWIMLAFDAVADALSPRGLLMMSANPFSTLHVNMPASTRAAAFFDETQRASIEIAAATLQLHERTIMNTTVERLMLARWLANGFLTAATSRHHAG